MTLVDRLLNSLPEGDIMEVTIGLHWTAVVVSVDGQTRCGLASTLTSNDGHFAEPDVALAGRLHTLPGRELAAYARSEQPIEASIGFAAINAMLPPPGEQQLTDLNADEVIAAKGAGKTVVVVGSFPFIPGLRPRVGELLVLERNPGEGELPESAAADVIPRADVVAITGMTLVNHSLDSLLSLCSPGATVLLLGASTPLSPILFDYGVTLLSGAIVTEIDPVLRAVRQGAKFRQIHKAGARLVTMRR